MSQAADIKQATNIVEVIGERIKLDRSGINHRGLCPFHGEKSPSFFVNEPMQRYRCFGCSASGDVFEFLQQYEGMSFAEALQYLADKAGITLQSFQPTGQDAIRERLLGILDLTKEYYHYLLTQHAAGEPAREYLKQRGVTQESIKLFQLGYALPSWDGLLKYLTQRKHHSSIDLEMAGLVVKNQSGRSYDRFRGRVMFPLRNHRGQVVGFSGRVLDATAKEAKYINSPETSLYHKSELLYGYSELFHEIKKKQQVIVMEGELDLISSTQAHVNNVVAIKGSALTEAQIKLLGRSATQVLLALDADDAGIKATQRAIDLIAQTTLELRVIDFGHSPDLAAANMTGKDPDLIARHNPKLWRQTVEQSVSAYEFLLRAALERHDPASPEGKKHIINELAPSLSKITHAVEQDYYVQKLAAALNVRADLVAKDISTFSVLKTTASTATTSTRNEPKKTQLSKRAQTEEYLLYLTLHLSAAYLQQQKTILQEIEYETQSAGAVMLKLIDGLKSKSPLDMGAFVQSLPPDLQTAAFSWYLNPKYDQIVSEQAVESEWLKTVHELKKLQHLTKIAALQTELQQLDSQEHKTPQQEERITQLLQQIVLLQQQQRTQ